MKIFLFLFNAIPLFQLITIFCVVVCPLTNVLKSLLVFLIVYIFPPLIARLCQIVLPIKTNKIDAFSKEYYIWWFQFNLQVLYLRLPFTEELIRFIPSLYSIWLRMWGSKIGAFVYWAPGLKVLDRSYLNIGDFVVFGADVRLNPHVIIREEEKNILLLDTIVIKKNVIVGGYSLITAGAQIEEDESLTAFSILTPFCIWKNGKRVKPKF